MSDKKGVRMKGRHGLGILTVLLAFSLSSMGATTDSFILRGKLESFCEIDVQPTAKATALDLANGENRSVVANMVAYGNDPSGLEVQIASGQGAKVVHTADATQEFGYALKYVASEGNDNTAISMNQPNVYELLDERSSYGAMKGALDITLTGDSTKAAGTYEDVVYLSCSLPGEGK